MKVLLVAPITVYRGTPKPLWSPLGLTFIASRLRADGHAVAICDRHAVSARLGPDRSKVDRAMLEQLRAFRPDLIGMTTVSPLIHDTALCVALIRESYPGPIVAGGHHATALPELTLEKIPGLSGVVVREGELPMAALANGEDPCAIPGVFWRSGDGRFGGAECETNRSLDRLPLPAMDLLDMDYYTTPVFAVFRGRYLSTACVLWSRGCTRRCAFCSESLTFGSEVRYHSPRYMIEWIKKLLVDYRVDGVYFLDNHFLANEERTRELCEAMLSTAWPRRFRWAVQARADAIHPDILGLMKRAGLATIEIGVESASEERLRLVGKGTTVEANERAIALCRKAGITAFAYMMTGFEGETLADLETALAWVKRIKPDGFGFRPLQRYPGTRLYETEGGRFFEEREWSERNIADFYKRFALSGISGEALEAWMADRYEPYETFCRCVSALKGNPPWKLLSFALREPGTALEVASRSARACCGRDGRAGSRESPRTAPKQTDRSSPGT